MSYCRFSSMNWMCDVYVYEHCDGGWTTHVAGRRRAIPPIPSLPLHRFPRWGGRWDQERRETLYPTRWHRLAAHIGFRIYGLWDRLLHQPTLDLIPLRDIGLPHDGAAFNDETPGKCADRLEALRAIGYKVPQYAIDALREEATTPPEAPGHGE